MSKLDLQPVGHGVHLSTLPKASPTWKYLYVQVPIKMVTSPPRLLGAIRTNHALHPAAHSQPLGAGSVMSGQPCLAAQPPGPALPLPGPSSPGSWQVSQPSALSSLSQTCSMSVSAFQGLFQQLIPSSRVSVNRACWSVVAQPPLLQM